MKKIVTTLGLAFLTSSVTIACGGGGGGDGDALGGPGGGNNGGGNNGGGSVNSGVPGSKLGSDLTEAEAQKVCEAIGRYGASKITEQDACRMAGALGAIFLGAFNPEATDEELQAACQDGFQACLEEPAEEPVPGDEADCVAQNLSEQCTATVQELEACFKDYIDLTAEAFKVFPTCEEITMSFVTDPEVEEPDTSLPASCAVVEEKCPEVLAFEDISDEDFFDEDSE